MIREWAKLVYEAPDVLVRLRCGNVTYTYGSGPARIVLEAPDEEIERAERTYRLVRVKG